MTGIEEKFSRLPPDLQREVEDYIDFLLKRHSPSPEKERVLDFPASVESPPAKPIILADEIPFRHDPEILPGYKDFLQPAGSEDERDVALERPARLNKSQVPDPGRKLLDWID